MPNSTILLETVKGLKIIKIRNDAKNFNDASTIIMLRSWVQIHFLLVDKIL